MTSNKLENLLHLVGRFSWKYCRNLWHSVDRASWYICIIRTNNMLLIMQTVGILSNLIGYFPGAILIHCLNFPRSISKLFSSSDWLRFILPWLRFFCAFSSVARQMPGWNSQRRGTARTLPHYLLFVLFGCYLCCSMYCLCVNVYCRRVTTQLQLINLSHLRALFPHLTFQSLQPFFLLIPSAFPSFSVFCAVQPWRSNRSADARFFVTLIGCPKTSVTNYQPMPHSIPEVGTVTYS